jgi:hypothetical protein
MASAHFWRMEYTDKRPEAFSDSASVVDRSRRTIRAVSVSFIILISLELLYAVMLTIFADSLSQSDTIQLIFAEMFFVVLTVALGIVLLVLRKNQKR